MQIRVSPEVNALLDDAVALSVRRGHPYVGVEHLFEAVLQQPDQLPGCIGSEEIRQLNQAAQELARRPWQGAMPPTGHDIFYTPRCAEAARRAAQLAERFGGKGANAGHVMLALLSDPHAAPSRALDGMGNGRQKLLEKLRAELHQGGAANQAAKRHQADAKAAPSGGPETPQQSSNGLKNLTRDITHLAELGMVERAVGRSRETFQLLEILTRKNKNNAILVGEAGTGKTRIVESLAHLLASEKTGEILSGYRILELNMAALQAGTQYRGAFEERVSKLLEEIAREKKIILFIDEIHLMMGAGATEGSSMDLANLLKPALARGEIRCIGATTLQEYRKFIEKDPAIERRFQMVRIEELSPSATLEVLEKLRPSLEEHHAVRISSRAIRASVRLTQRYMPNRRFPDKAIDALDQACARYRLRMVAAAAKEKTRQMEAGTITGRIKEKVTPHDVRKVVSRATSIPIEEITAAERQRIEDLDRRLKRRVIGQDHAVEKAVAAVKKARAGLADPDRPDAVMLFLGPTGVGKTELAKALSDELFGSDKHLIRFDMGEYIEEHSVSRLLGAPPGYKGSDQEGRLTGAVRNTPFSILLFDEIEKAHRRIFDIFLPILDEGRLKDSHGREVSFRNCIILFTSNIGAGLIDRGESVSGNVMGALRNHFRPEFINRIDEIVPFYPLLFEDVRAMLKLNFRSLARRLREKGMHLRVYQGAYEYLAHQGYDREFGARELRRTVDQLVVNPVSSMLLEGTFKAGDCIEVLMVDEELTFRRTAAVPREEARQR